MKVKWVATGILAAAGIMAVPSVSQAGIAIFVGHRHRDTYRIGFDRGYEDGLRHGAKDEHRHDSYNFWHDKRYRCGDAGYHRRYGPKHEYVAGYRRGYEQAYRNAYAGMRHRHHGQDGYCYLRHERDDDRDRYRERDRYRDRDRDDEEDENEDVPRYRR